MPKPRFSRTATRTSTRQLMGVPDEGAGQKAASTLQALGSERAFVVTGDRVDELPLDDSGVILDVSPSGVVRRTVTAADHGLPTSSTDDLRGGDASENAAIIEAIVDGRERGPRRDVVVLNAGAALLVAGVATDLRTGVARAVESIDTGAAAALLARLQARAQARAAEAGAS
jgi:anthranilate phosphoribosyltransferase